MAYNLNKDTVYKSVKPKDKDYFINDGGGLNLVIKTSSAKLWRFVYTFDSKRKKLALGAYPKISLETARRQAEESRQQIANGIDPGQARKQLKAAKQLDRLNEDRLSEGLPILNSFADVAKQWLDSLMHLTNPLPTPRK